jgi:hypothetical protein
MLGNFKKSVAFYVKASRQAKSFSATLRPAKTAAQPLKGYYYQSPGIIKISPNILNYEAGTE